MNQRFLVLEEEKRKAVINSGFRNFALFGYRKASMRDIAEDAGVSKALLFHYFDTKKEFYLHLWSFVKEETAKSLKAKGATGDKDYFSSMEKGLKAKMELSRTWPWMALFAAKAYYEKDEEVVKELKVDTDPFLKMDGETIRRLYPETHFRKDIDLTLMYKEMYYMSEGYLWHWCQEDEFDVDRMEKDYLDFISQWKRIYREQQ